jgi:hypothetical protein
MAGEKINNFVKKPTLEEMIALNANINLNPKGTGLYNDDIRNSQPKPSVGKYKFLKSHTVTFPIKFKEDALGWGDGHKKFDTIESKSFTFKVGDIINSELSTFNPSSNVMDWDINLKINNDLGFQIPKSILQKVDDSSTVTEYKESDFPTPIKYDSSGKLIKNTSNNNDLSFLQKNKTNLLILGVLVLGYLAYKKFNK